MNIIIHKRTGVITLNCSNRLNSLNIYMLYTIKDILCKWNKDCQIDRIVLRSKCNNLCSGADLKDLYFSKNKLKYLIKDFFDKEYKLCHSIYSLKKPYISLLNGISMGAGLGLSINGSYRFVTDSSIIAMPETTIGFFPDIGSIKFLNKYDESVGLYLGMTGININVSDALWLGLGTNYIPNAYWNIVCKKLIEGKNLKNIITNFSYFPQKTGEIQCNFKYIKKFFSIESLEDLINSLVNDNSYFAKKTLQILNGKSPISLIVTFAYFKYIKNINSFYDIMKLEFYLSQFFTVNSNFTEGIRSLLVDKDKKPEWPYGSIVKNLRKISICSKWLNNIF